MTHRNSYAHHPFRKSSPQCNAPDPVSFWLCPQQPFHCEIEHKLGLTCLTSGPVLCRVRLDRGGYVPGETIGVWATIDNQSRVTVKKTAACLSEVSPPLAGVVQSGNGSSWSGCCFVLRVLVLNFFKYFGISARCIYF